VSFHAAYRDVFRFGILRDQVAIAGAKTFFQNVGIPRSARDKDRTLGIKYKLFFQRRQITHVAAEFLGFQQAANNLTAARFG
jgi:hypothetical protein